MEERIEPHVTGVQVLSTVLERKRSFNRHNGRRDQGRTGKDVDEAVKHADELRDAAETANGKLASRNSPYRFYVYNEGGEIYLDLVILCEDGSIQKTGRRNITHEEFSDWLIHLERGEGLLFDTNG
jgi:hypothetical protein